MNLIEKALERTTDTRACIMGEGVLCKAPDMFRSLFGDVTGIVVADNNTWKAAGKEVASYMAAAGIKMEKPFIFTDPDLFAEWGYLEQLEVRLRNTDATPVAIGSGVINDLTKLASEHLGRRYMVVGTAASMDGYTAFGASITYKGNKQTFSCKAPLGLILDAAVAAKAPEGLSASGYADLIAKVPAGAEWMIAEAAGADAIDRFSFDLVQGPLRASLANPLAVANGSVKETLELSSGLVMSGFAMQACRSSRPASGIEHQFSHYWDMEGLCFNGKHVSHGFKVAIGTLVSTASLEFLLEKGMEDVDPDKAAAAWPSLEEQERTIRRLFEEKPLHMERALTENRNKYTSREGVREQIRSIKDAWPELSAAIRAQIMPYEEVLEKLRLVGAPYEPQHIGISREKLHSTFQGIPYMRSRYTSIDLILRAGILPELEERLFGKGGHWEIPHKHN